MTKTSRKWRNKRLKRKRVYIKIHKSILGAITGMMAVFFLLSLCSLDNVNKYVIASYCISFTWLSIIVYANNFDCVEVGD